MKNPNKHGAQNKKKSDKALAELEMQSEVTNTSHVMMSPMKCHQHTPNDTYKLDVKNLSKKALREKYSGEYTAWRSRKAAAAKEAIPFAPEFDDFPNFLLYIGPKPAASYTLDKMDSELGYVPENIRWATKQTQSRNRKCTKMLSSGADIKPLVVWAEATHQSANTMRQRLRRGWSDEEVIAGQREALPNTMGPRLEFWCYTPWPEDRRVEWEEYYRKHGSDSLRLNFYLETARTNMARLSEEMEYYTYPEEHSPTLKEREALTKWERDYMHWKGILTDARAKARMRCKVPPPLYAWPMSQRLEEATLKALAKQLYG